MNLKEIKELIEFFNKSETSKIKIKQNDFEIELERNILPKAIDSLTSPNIKQITNLPNNPVITQAVSSQETASSINEDFILSPMVGTFYHCPSPGAAPYVKVGDTIKKGQTIGIVEAMKIMNEIEAEFNCKIIAIEANDGQPVEFGSKLIKVEKI